MSPADGATLPSYGGTCRVGKYSVPTAIDYNEWSTRYSVQEDCRPVREGHPTRVLLLGGF